MIHSWYWDVQSRQKPQEFKSEKEYESRILALTMNQK